MTAQTPIANGRTPCNAACGGCGHVWTVAWLPMGVMAAARCYSRACCPSCGATKNIFMAPSEAVSEPER